MSRLDDRFADIDRQLATKLKEARTSTAHRGVRGDELAGALGGEIHAHFVECASFYEKCEVRDTHGAVSQEVDLVLLNRFHPAFLLKERPRAFYIEGVIAGAEVKTSLNKTKMVECLEAAQAFKRLLAKVSENERDAHGVDNADWDRYLVRRPFFAFAYEDARTLPTVKKNIEEWTRDNHVPDVEQIDAVFILNRGIIVNLGGGTGAIEIPDAVGGLIKGFVRSETRSIFSQLILWLSLVCPSFSRLNPILLKYASFGTDGYVS